MTTIRPKQMRALADRADEAGAYEVMETGIVDELATNLRAAADQLEAVAEWRESGQCGGRSYAALGRILNGESDD